MNLNINSETSKLKEVLIGNSYNFKSPLNFRDLYDPTSLLNYLKGKYPNKFRLQSQLLELKKILVKKKFKVVFMSRNSDQYKACKIEKFKTYSLNILFSK